MSALVVKVKLGDIIPSHIVEIGIVAKNMKILDKEVIIKDHGLYNRLKHIVTHYQVHGIEKCCQKTYDSFGTHVGWLNEMLKEFRVGLMKSSGGMGMHLNPFNQEPWMLESTC